MNFKHHTLIFIAIAMLLASFWSPEAMAAGIRVVPSSTRVLPGQDFYFDVVAEGIPSEGLGTVQFRLNLTAPGGTIAGVVDLGQAASQDIAVSAPLLPGPPSATRSGI